MVVPAPVVPFGAMQGGIADDRGLGGLQAGVAGGAELGIPSKVANSNQRLESDAVATTAEVVIVQEASWWLIAAASPLAGK